MNNIPPQIAEKIGRNLHLEQHHPLNIIKAKIENYCNEYAKKYNQSSFDLYDKESPIAHVKNCFDDLLVPPDHVSRSRRDTYYIDDQHVI
jgi:phenylalanyl-tRNA synthetase alpha chain